MLGFIGTGNMASAIISGVVSSGFADGKDIAVYDVLKEKANQLSERYGVSVCESESEVVSKCDKVVLAIKPNILESVLLKIKGEVSEKAPLLISIAAGKSLEFLSSYLEEGVRLVRVMPNINAVVGEAISAYCANKNASFEDKEFACKLCSSFGKAVEVPEAQFPIFGVIGGCSPAWAYMFIDCMARAAVKNSMPKKQALEICAQAVLGSAKMILESGEHPYELVDRVCSPGGTTIEGVLSLQRDGFESAVANAVNASYEKDKKI